MLEKLTFTGIDLWTTSWAIQDVQDEFPLTEFGILIGSKTKETANVRRFPPFGYVENVRRLQISGYLNLAVHLCGKFSRDVTQPNGDMSRAMAMCEGFQRVQVNSVSYPDPDRIAAFADAVSCDHVILQRRRGALLGDIHPKVEYLFDLSGGRGAEDIGRWPVPEAGVRSGYAGGLGPSNIEKAMEFVDSHSDKRLWLDMESGVRTDDWLDMGKVVEVCGKAFP